MVQYLLRGPAIGAARALNKRSKFLFRTYNSLQRQQFLSLVLQRIERGTDTEPTGRLRQHPHRLRMLQRRRLKSTRQHSSPELVRLILLNLGKAGRDPSLQRKAPQNPCTESVDRLDPKPARRLKCTRKQGPCLFQIFSGIIGD